jgi:hypothetical protein
MFIATGSNSNNNNSIIFIATGNNNNNITFIVNNQPFMAIFLSTSSMSHLE